MLNARVQNSGYAPSTHRHRLPNLHQKLVANTPKPAVTQAPELQNEPGWFRMVMYISIVLALFASAAFLIAKYAGDEIARAGHTINQDVRRIAIGSDIVTLPANMIRYSSQRRLAKAKQLDLYLHWPELQGYSEGLKHVFNDTRNNANIIFVTLSPRFSTYDMSARIKPIYRKFFVGDANGLGNGLISHDLDAKAGFIDEYLIVEKNNPYPFSARCSRNKTSIATPFCIRDIHIGEGLSLSYRFHEKLIPHWRALERSIRSKFAAMLG